ncbi:hypothetical protein HUG10_00730 [Halorarum halophilum]|uniref:DUF8159 domain-containing protein n=1 Tax=Halorarum halophilum TaxID=2743090 RepID=A0A7D5GDG1_9EURY|nr:hypothetical protein [Halobaculum halophilum]QLG26150.1 hypothetical protein HUG10_00730 [Halobaculum halophilum]
MPGDLTGPEAALRSNGISVESLSRGDTLALTYLTAFPGASVNHQEMGRACNTFIELTEEGAWDPVPVEATVVRAPGDVQGRWRLDPDWIRDLGAYRISEEEFSARVLDTLEEPAVGEP